jgi:oligoribonuclease NrnB/cAMP/cGMP phosphodiesterase (DHH superfamily)
MLVLAHGDSDGLLSLSLLMRVKDIENPRDAVFTSPASLKDSLCRAMVKRKLDELYVLDLSGDRKTVRIASSFDKVLWLDHHEWGVDEHFDNVEIVVKRYPSAAQVVDEYFNLNEKRIVEIANEIDKNDVRSDEARFLRSLVGAVRWKYWHNYVESAKKLFSIAKLVSKDGIDAVFTEENEELVREFECFLDRSIREEVIPYVKTASVNGLRVAIYQSSKFLPIYAITNRLVEHPAAPFDIIAILSYRVSNGGIVTKMEFRTHTGFEVIHLAQYFNGGGHKVACGATVNAFISFDELIKVIERIYGARE